MLNASRCVWASLPVSRLLLALLALAMGLRFVAMGVIPLIPEEAYYWMYSRHLSFGYYEHPPMVALVIRLGTEIFGNNEFGVRIVGCLLMIGASALLYRFGRMWFSRRAALLAALLPQLLPLYFGFGFIATMDSALVFFWALCLVGVSVALKRERAWGWYLAGLGLGGAMLSKYTGVFLAPGIVLTVALYRPWRRRLANPHFYLGMALAAALFAPVILWNARHDWVSFRFQFLERFGEDEFELRNVGIFLLYQMLVAMPPVLIGGACLLVRLARTRRLLALRWLVAAAFCLPLFALMTYKSFRSEIHVNWTFPLYLSLFPALMQAWLAARRRFSAERRPYWVRALPATLMTCALFNVIVAAGLLAFHSHLPPNSALAPWKELAWLVEEHEDRLELQTGRQPLIVGNGRYRLASELAFYMRPIEQPFDAAHHTTSQWILAQPGLAFPYWAKPEQWRGRDCIFVVDDPDDEIIEDMAPYFESVEMIDDPRLDLLAGKGTYRLAIGRNLWPHGYPTGEHAPWNR